MTSGNEWQKKHPEARKRYQKKYYLKNKAKIIKQQKKWKKKNKEKIKAWRRAYYVKNREKLNDRNKRNQKLKRRNFKRASPEEVLREVGYYEM